jgi:AraC-like DNA-binding protein
VTEPAGLLEALLALPGIDAPPGPVVGRIHLIHPAALPGTEWITALASQQLWRVFHEDYELCVVPPDGNSRDAGGDYSYRRWSVDCRPGAVYFLEPDTLHANHQIYAPSNFYVLKVARASVAALGRELGLGERPHFAALSSSASVLSDALAALAGALVRGADELELESRLLHTLRTALAAGAEDRPRVPTAEASPELARARDYLHAHATARVTLEELARVSGLSRYHLLRSFARAYGLPPHAYQTQLRVAEARRQLAAGVAPSAIEVGFFDQTHLARHFRRAYAVTPAAYQRAISS